MQHKVKLTVIDKKLYPDLQAQYCADPASGACSCYHVGDEFIFERYGTADDFWHMGLNTLKQTVHTAEGIAGGTVFPHCSEAWDAISRYIYTGLQGGSIMRGWMNDERVMIACCSDGTRPVIFKIERMDYKAVYIDSIADSDCQNRLITALKQINDVKEIIFRENYAEVYLQNNVEDEVLKNAVESCGEYLVVKID
ncbi:hypothetical protein GCM10008922_25760 [Faecalicatena contorta]|uniref:TIGR04076 family protein n=1 Tax=Faecalicatena contorta TaxID=39482 RepID=UPI0031D977BB